MIFDLVVNLWLSKVHNINGSPLNHTDWHGESFKFALSLPYLVSLVHHGRWVFDRLLKCWSSLFKMKSSNWEAGSRPLPWRRYNHTDTVTQIPRAKLMSFIVVHCRSMSMKLSVFSIHVFPSGWMVEWLNGWIWSKGVVYCSSNLPFIHSFIHAGTH